jgi:23S rRNA (uracil1939-C5)-methyltransferase
MSRIITEEESRNSSVTADVEKLVYGGEGLARVEGQVLLTPFVLPGERIQVLTKRAKAGLLRGASPEILQASPQRVVPRCEYFGTCGGCQYQHGDYPLQLEAKRGILRETLQRLGGIRYEEEIPIISGEPWNYRNRVQLHFTERRVGFRRSESHDLRPITHCEISSPAINDVIAKLNEAVRRPEWPDFLRSLEVFTNEDQIQLNVLDSERPVAARFFTWCQGLFPSLVENAIPYQMAEYSFRVSRGSFFQVNRFLIENLVQEALGNVEGERAIDLYAGVGLFSLPLARRFRTVDAVERSGPAYRDVQWNTSQEATNVCTIQKSAEDFLRSVTEAPEFLLVDPPRAGLGADTTREILRIAPLQVTYVTCDVSTMARDLQKLMTAYTITRVTLVDLFPQTYHFESVVHLRRK